MITSGSCRQTATASSCAPLQVAWILSLGGGLLHGSDSADRLFCNDELVANSERTPLALHDGCNGVWEPYDPGTNSGTTPPRTPAQRRHELRHIRPNIFRNSVPVAPSAVKL